MELSESIGNGGGDTFSSRLEYVGTLNTRRFPTRGNFARVMERQLSRVNGAIENRSHKITCTKPLRRREAASDLAWGKVKPFKNVDAARLRYLTIAEAKRLINASEPDFRLLAQAALQTAARYSELARLTV